MDRACFVMGSVAREGSFRSGIGTRMKVYICEDLMEVWLSPEGQVVFFF